MDFSLTKMDFSASVQNPGCAPRLVRWRRDPPPPPRDGSDEEGEQQQGAADGEGGGGGEAEEPHDEKEEDDDEADSPVRFGSAPPALPTDPRLVRPRDVLPPPFAYVATPFTYVATD